MEESIGKLKVLHVMRILNVGGIGMFAMNLYRECQEDIEFHFAIAYNSYGDFGNEIIKRGGKIYYLSEKGNNTWKDGIKQLISLHKLLKQEKYDVIHCHYYFANTLFLLIAKLHGVKKRVSHCHNTRSYKVTKSKEAMERLYKGFLSKVATDMIGCSDAATQFLYTKKDIQEGRAKTIYNGIDYSRWNPQKYNKDEMRKKYCVNKAHTNFIFVGRLEKQKNPFFMLEVFEKIHKEEDFCSLTIIGYGSLEEELRYKVKELELKSCVKFLGPNTDIAEIMSIMDYMLAPSLWEGLSIAFIEAQAMNVQVFTSNLVSKEIDMGLCSFLPLDASSWKDTILEFLKNERKKLKEPLIEKKELFDIKNTLKNVLALYRGGNLLDKNHWDDCHSKFEYRIESEEDKNIKFFEKWIPKAEKEESCFEIGCCPCRFLAYIGQQFKYEINGLDYSDGINDNLINWLHNEKLKIGVLIKGDFNDYIPEKKYNVVYSAGFIEHFKNYQEIIQKHDLYLQPGGLLLITTPNFRGWIQRCLHLFLDRDNYKEHYIPSMQPEEWADILKNMGYDILFCGYFGGFEFWCKSTNFWVLRFLRIPVKALNKLLKNKDISSHKAYSPYCGIVARKTNLNRRAE